ncbi:hypothetical protein [Paenibacillus azoreducens]|nr:hypothetical protein [Paenibacillus azoreducens]
MMMQKLKPGRLAAAVLLSTSICLWLGGCGLWNPNSEPEALFKQTLGGLAGKDSFRFTGKAAIRTESNKEFRESVAYEGILTEHDKLTIRSMLPAQPANAKKPKQVTVSNFHAAESGFRRQDGEWVHLFSEGNGMLSTSLARFNPLAQLDAIGRLPKQIKEASGAARGTRVLRIELNPTAARGWLAEQLEEEMGGIRQQANQAAQIGSSRDKRELADAWKKGDAQMKQMLDQSEVGMVYYLTIDKRSGFPLKLSSETNIRYLNLHNQEEEESLINDVSFIP